MLHDPELSALLEQAERNLDTLELLVRGSGEQTPDSLGQLRQRLKELKRAYTSETDVLTRQVLKRAIERRSSERRGPSRKPDGV